MEALHDVVKAGKARYIGASSMYAWQFAKAQSVARTRFVSMQNHYNLVYREEEREMIPQCLDQGVAVLPWSPLARGLLAGNRTREGEKLTTRAKTDEFGDSLYTPELDFAVVDRAAEVAAAARGHERADRARLAVAQARCDGADRRGDEGRAPRGRDRRRAAVTERGRDRAARGAVRPARYLRPLAPRRRLAQHRFVSRLFVRPRFRSQVVRSSVDLPFRRGGWAWIMSLWSSCDSAPPACTSPDSASG